MKSPLAARPAADGGADSAARDRRIGWAGLAIAMAVSAAWLLISPRGTSFSGDELYYYASYVGHGLYATEVGHGLEYFLAPHNGHLQVAGKLLYRVLFELFGTDYTVFRAVNVAGILIAVGLFYVLARRRVGPLAALAPSVAILFLGYAWEPMIWAFDMHTVYALVFGLAALLALERGGRRGDVWACLLLVLSVAMIELGLAFLVGVAVSVLLRPDRWRRVWIFAIPLVLYAIWWVWARRFHQVSIDLGNVHLIPIDVTNALAAIAGSLTGLNPTGGEIPVQLTTVTAAGTFLAGLAVVGLAVRIRRGAVPPTLWVFLAVAVAYWITIALGERSPDSSRYLLAGTVLVLLVAADAVSRVSFSILGIAGLFAVFAVALPANLTKFYEGRTAQLNDATISRTEDAMLELAGARGEPGYIADYDPALPRAGKIAVTLPAIEYLRADREFGPLGYSLQQVREQTLKVRQIADAALADALGLGLRQASAPASVSGCLAVEEAAPGDPAYFPLRPGGVLLGSRSKAPLEVRVSRFAKDGGGHTVGELQPGSWATLKAPPDNAPEPWRALVTGPAYVCPAAGS